MLSPIQLDLLKEVIAGYTDGTPHKIIRLHANPVKRKEIVKLLANFVTTLT